MKIVSLTDFLLLPNGTVFSKYMPCVFASLSIKGDSIKTYRDFYYQQIADALPLNKEFSDECRDAENGEDVPLDFDLEGRDGMYEENQLFAVWSNEDVRHLINRLSRCLQPPQKKVKHDNQA